MKIPGPGLLRIRGEKPRSIVTCVWGFRQDTAVLNDKEPFGDIDDRIARHLAVQKNHIRFIAYCKTIIGQLQRFGSVGGKHRRHGRKLLRATQMAGYNRKHRDLQDIAVFVRCKGISNIIGGKAHVDAAVAQPAHRGNRAPHIVRIIAPAQVQIAGRVITLIPASSILRIMRSSHLASRAASAVRCPTDTRPW